MNEEVIPILRVSNAAGAVAWYQRLGFVQEWEHRFEPGLPAFVSVARGGTALLRSLLAAWRRGRAPAGFAATEHLSQILLAFGTTTHEAGPAMSPVTGLVETLTDRELEVLRLLAAGRRNRDIAEQLVVTVETVKKHVSHILTKMGAASRTEAVAQARRLGLID